jgi:hypothetical protein
VLVSCPRVLRCVSPLMLMLMLILIRCFCCLLQGTTLSCSVPTHPSFDGVRDLTVPFAVVLSFPAVPVSVLNHLGIGKPELLVDGNPGVAMRLSAVVATSLIRSPSRRRLTAGAEPGRFGQAEGSIREELSHESMHALRPKSKLAFPWFSWRSSVYEHALTFTYTASGRVCGCDTSAPSACDACGVCLPQVLTRGRKLLMLSVAGVCGGSNRTRDCAGVCFGSASYDDCGMCSGGTTPFVPEGARDCRGICNGTSVCSRTARVYSTFLLPTFACSDAVLFWVCAASTAIAAASIVVIVSSARACPRAVVGPCGYLFLC